MTFRNESPQAPLCDNLSAATIPSMRQWQGAALLLSALAFLPGCAAGLHHTSDAALERVFNQHEPEFEALLSEVRSDSQLTTIQPKVLIYGGRHLDIRERGVSADDYWGLTRERWERYQAQLRNLGLAGGILKGEREVEFRVDPGSILNGDSYKGYVYTQSPPPRLLSSLDSYRISDRDRDQTGGWSVWRRLKGNWYLYLFVNP